MKLSTILPESNSRGKEALRFSDYVVSLGEGAYPMTDAEADVIMSLGQKLLKRGYEFHSFKDSSTGMNHDGFASFDFPRPDWAQRDYESGSMVHVNGDVHAQVAGNSSRVSFEHLNSLDLDELHEAITQMIASTNKVKDMLK